MNRMNTKRKQKSTEQTIRYLGYILGESCYNKDNKDNISPFLIQNAAEIVCDHFVIQANLVARNLGGDESYWRLILDFICFMCENANGAEHTDVDNTNKGVYLDLLEQTLEKKKKKKNYHNHDNSIKNQEYEQKRNQLIEELEISALQDCGVERSDFCFIRKNTNENMPTPGTSQQTEENKDENMQTPGTSQQTEENKNDICCSCRSYQYRLNHVRYGYAVAHIGDIYEAIKHISFLLDSIYEYKMNYDFEKRFLKDAFTFIESCPSFIDYYCDKFFFVLEFCLIEICTYLIRTAPQEDIKVEFGTEHPLANTYFIGVACKNNELIFRKVKNLLLDLYERSQFNSHVDSFRKKLEVGVEAL